mgnify:CR=1 FL=1
MKHFDVIVVGAGHAGVEAALAAARRGAETALITFRETDIGVMSCNPAIGGVGKGHLVREIDALDGMMGLAADYAGIQYRLLNRSRGPAVQGPRVQADRGRYREFSSRFVASAKRVTVLEGEVCDLRVQSGRVSGVTLGDGTEVAAGAVVLTTGTFLQGEIHVGASRTSAGRLGARSSNRLGQFLRGLSTSVGRLKTGTPARLDRNSIDWSVLGVQNGDDNPVMMSFLTTGVQAPQISCGITETNASTHEIIQRSLHLSAMRSGNITGVGPRYCPSVEDKVTRFADKSSHNVFLEPEGIDSDVIYPNGLSTSLPADVQEAFLRSIKGLQDVVIVQHGYAIEYDFLDPKGLLKTLQFKDVQGLFLAGQINGTTGYEEAAAQGLVAGANAAAEALSLEPLVLNRTQSYIGVMIDDLTEKGVTEPYRMFTSRAEFRLSLRADNADQRLTESGLNLGLVSEGRRVSYLEKMDRLSDTKRRLAAARIPASRANDPDFLAAKFGPATSLLQVAARVVSAGQDISDYHDLFASWLDQDVFQVAVNELYEPYIRRQEKEAERLQADQALPIPHDLDYRELSSLSSELVGKLDRLRPRSIGDALKVEGMTPAAHLVLLAAVRKPRESARAARG